MRYILIKYLDLDFFDDNFPYLRCGKIIIS
jgi:hypothetical protein